MRQDNTVFDNGETSWDVLDRSELVDAPVHRPAIGLIELATEVLLSAEVRAFLPSSELAFYTSRVAFDDNPYIAGLSKMEADLQAAAGLLPDSEWMHAIVYGCTSGSAVIGPERVAALINGVRPNVPVVTPIGAIVTALKALNCQKISVVTPYPQETNRVMARFLSDSGFSIANAKTFACDSGYEMSRIPPERFLEAGQAADHPDADAIFLSCTAINASPILEELEHRTGKPVVCSNQAIAWQCDNLAGGENKSLGRGRLFQQHPGTWQQQKPKSGEP